MRNNTWRYDRPEEVDQNYDYGLADLAIDWLGINNKESDEHCGAIKGWRKHKLQTGELQSWAKIIGLMEGKWPGNYRAVKHLYQQEPDLNVGKFKGYLLSMKIYGRNMSINRSMRVVCVIERYRLDEGKLPDSLAELVPGYLEVKLLDPFTGEELIYRKEAGSYVVYGLGRGLKRSFILC